jgi:hypothetical protein
MGHQAKTLGKIVFKVGTDQASKGSDDGFEPGPELVSRSMPR